MRSPPVTMLPAILLSSFLWACAGTPERSGVRDYLEEATGTSITYVTTPVAFVNEQPGLASSGRDYVYLAPIGVSGGGERSYWLWLGTWSTVDRPARRQGADPLSLGPLQIIADDEPMDLYPLPAGEGLAGIRQIPYSTPVGPTQEFLVPVTRSQIGRLARARELKLDDRLPGGTFRPWYSDDRATAVVREFAGEVGAVRTEPVPDAQQ